MFERGRGREVQEPKTVSKTRRLSSTISGELGIAETRWLRPAAVMRVTHIPEETLARCMSR